MSDEVLSQEKASDQYKTDEDQSLIVLSIKVQILIAIIGVALVFIDQWLPPVASFITGRLF